MPIAGGIALLVVGAILKFALTGGPVHGIDLRIVGVILMLAGAVGLLLPFLVRPTRRSNRPLTRSRQDDIDNVPQGYVESQTYDSLLEDPHRIPDGRRPQAGDPR
jgi:hypothetical protein